MEWYAIYTKSRHEKKVEAQLLEKNIEAYCPKIKVERKWSDRYKIIEEPLFRSYCFVKVALAQKYEILNTTGVVKFVNFKGQMAKIRESEIRRIKAILSEFEGMEIKAVSFQIDDIALISSGAFIDQSGTVLKTDGKKITLYLEELGVKIVINQENNILSKKEKKRTL